MKILNESLKDFLKFKESSDPIEDMGIGIRQLIKSWMHNNKILDEYDYHIDSDTLLINTYNNTIVSNLNIKKFPEYIQFGKVIGGFHCEYNGMETLKGSPFVVLGSFLCSWNNLRTLEYSPKEVKGNFIASHNDLISLKGIPKKLEQSISISYNNLNSLKYIPNIIYGDFLIHQNPIETLKYFPSIIKGSLYYTRSDIINEDTIRERCNVEGNLIEK